jgi:orotate phosphoribosyltransferase
MLNPRRKFRSFGTKSVLWYACPNLWANFIAPLDLGIVDSPEHLGLVCLSNFCENGDSSMLPANHEERPRLKDLLCQKSLSTDGDFKLHSGEKSTVYVDAKTTTCSPEAMPLVGRVFLRKIHDQMWLPSAVGGLTVGADPIAFAIARESLDAGRPINAFIVRKEPKKHGMQKYIEGLEQTEGRDVVIIDDVCTKGESTAQAIQKALDAGMRVLGAICLVDRQQGAADLLNERFGLSLSSIFTLAELLSHQNNASDSVDSVEHAHSC